MNAPIDPLAGFRSDGFGLDPDRRARMRARVLDAIPDTVDAPGSTTLTAVAAAPSATTAVLDDHDDAVLELERADDLAGDRVGGRVDIPRRAKRPTWSTGRRLLVAATIAAVIGLLAVVAGASRSSDRQVGTLDQASQKVTLDQLADIAARQPDRPLAAGQYQYLESTLALQLADGSFDINTDQNWHTADSSGYRSTATDTVLREDAADTPLFGGFTYDALRLAPTDPDDLIDAVTATTPGQSSQAIAEQIVQIEALTVTPPAVRAAGLRALAILGYQPIGIVTDTRGLTAVGFQADAPDGTEVLAFDPTTGLGVGYWVGTGSGTLTSDAATRWTTYSNGDITGPPA